MSERGVGVPPAEDWGIVITRCAARACAAERSEVAV